ncbi:MAG: efflux RND transporter periplasmic adaptor subunit [Burkholderiales bacterium]|nr:efflux RND transporter periplasmic adaptor subunit [Burkholderiales bacterium]
MNRALSVLAACGLVAASLAAGYWWGAGKSAPVPPAPVAKPEGAAGKGRILYYRNPMGLPDTSPVPKKDPMGMDYVPVYEGGEPAGPAGTVKISADKIQLLGVRTEAAAARELRHAVRAVGTIQANERLLYKIAPRFEGWIERLHVNTTGQSVGRGQPLMEVYSPELVSAQDEYLIALRGAKELQEGGAEAQAGMQRLAEGVLRRLRNFEISDQEIRRLQETGSAQRLLVYRSPVSGVVLQKPGTQGMRFMPGEVLYEIADLSSVWMLADVFEQELGLVRVGQEAKMRIAAYPDREFAGKVVFIYPTLDPGTRTGRVRIELANPGTQLKPAMYGNVELAAGESSGKRLAVPESAVLDSGTSQTVLVRRGEGLFEPRKVRLGTRAEGFAEILEGLKAGEEVVVRANFLIDAESNLKAALAGFGGKGESEGKAAVQVHAGKGTIEALDAKSASVEIHHEPMASLKWPAMTMEFKLRDKAMLAGLKKGQAVEFDLRVGAPGEFIIERIGPAGAPAAGHGKGH